MHLTGTSRPRRTGVLLAIALTILAFSGCGSSSTPEKNVKPGTGFSPETEATLEKLKSQNSQIAQQVEEQKKHKEEVEKKAKAAETKQSKKKGLKQPFR